MNKDNIIVIHPYLKANRIQKDCDLEEASKLTEAINLNPIFFRSIGLEKINPKTYLNKGDQDDHQDYQDYE